jgi:SAM-dependent methyltransferase
LSRPRPLAGRKTCQVSHNDLYANWARVYDYFYPYRHDEIDFWARTAAPHGDRLLDLMCGTSEVSLGLARRGYRVWGLDRSPAMLAVGADRLAAAADHPARSLSLLLADARAIPAAAGAFDFALAGGNGSFNHLPGEDARRALAELGRVLAPGGGLGLELVNPHLLKEVYAERSFGPFRPTPPGVQVAKIVTNRYDRAAGLFQVHQVTRFEIDGQAGAFEESFVLHVWLPEEVAAMLAAAGFGDVRFYGSYDLAAFDRWSADLLVLARAPI